jgi:2,3-dimethylmalate lyase
VADLLVRDNPRRDELRAALAQRRAVAAPGAYDALTARLVEDAGFEVVYMTGFGTTASLLGRPDVGLLGQAEMVDNARRIVQAVDRPVIADADTGYGNPINVIRTVREYEQAGVAAIHLEDQVSPKKCGHLAGKVVVPAEDMEAKVRAAVAARTDPDFVVIARTDARAVEGIDAAIERARRYADAGADVLFVEAPTSDEEVEQVATELADHTLVFNWAEGGRTPPVGVERLRELGYALVLFPIGALLAATAGVREHLEHLKAHGTPEGRLDRLPSFEEFTSLVGIDEVRALEERFRQV